MLLEDVHPGLGEELNNDVDDDDEQQQFTVFAPINTGFDAVFDAQPSVRAASEVVYTEKELARMVAFHVHPGTMPILSRELNCTATLTMASGDVSRTKCMKDSDHNDGNATSSSDVVHKYQKGNGNTNRRDALPKILPSSFSACNGIIHAVDNIMLPVQLENTITEEESDEEERVDQYDATTTTADAGRHVDDDNTADDDARLSNTKVIYIIRHGEKIYVERNITAVRNCRTATVARITSLRQYIVIYFCFLLIFSIFPCLRFFYSRSICLSVWMDVCIHPRNSIIMPAKAHKDGRGPIICSRCLGSNPYPDCAPPMLCFRSITTNVIIVVPDGATIGPKRQLHPSVPI